MTTARAVTAFLAAARKQHVLAAAQVRHLAPRMTGLGSPNDLRTWLPGRSGLPAEQIAKLLRLLPGPELVFNPYKPLAHLASGGMGRIWLAEAPSGELVVVKTLLAETTANGADYALDEDGAIWIDEQTPRSKASPNAAKMETPGSDLVQRLERETRITRSLSHPHIVRCIDHGLTPDGQIFLVLEYMASGDLRDLLDDHGPLPEPLVLSICRQVTNALDIAHKQQLLHRDVKPANIFLNADGHAKLADFGFARSNRANRTQLTLAGSVLGSPLYMAPEQVTADAALDIRCDLYGMGCVLFQCLTGTPPYQGTMHDVMRAHCVAQVPDVRRGHPHITHATAAIITRLLQKDPAARFSDPGALKLALIEALAGVQVRPDQLVPLPKLDTDSSARLRATTTFDMDLSGKAAAIAAAAAAAAAVAATAAQIAPGIASEWVTLAGDQQHQVCCWAKPSLTLGKFRGPGVDICLRDYPEEQHREACSRISRAHLLLQVNPASATHSAHLSIEDLGSANGTTMAGQPLPPKKPLVILGDAEHQIEFARAVRLAIRAIPTRDLTGGDPGLAFNEPFDGVVLRRPANRPELTYAIVMRRITIGGAGCDVVLPGASGRIDLARIAGHWVVRQAPGEPWAGLASGMVLQLGSVRLCARPGTPDDL